MYGKRQHLHLQGMYSLVWTNFMWIQSHDRNEKPINKDVRLAYQNVLLRT